MATIRLSGNKISSRHWLAFKTADKFQRNPIWYVSVTGIALLGNFAKGTGSTWKGHDLLIDVDISKPFDKIKASATGLIFGTPVLRSVHWTVQAGLNSIFNQSKAVNSGHAVDSFQLIDPQQLTNTATIKCALAVRDVDAFIHRVGFKLNLLVYLSGDSGGVSTTTTTATTATTTATTSAATTATNILTGGKVSGKLGGKTGRKTKD